MKNHTLHRRIIFRLFPILIILLAACGTENETPTPEPTETTAVIAAATDTPPPPTNTPTPEPTDLPPTETPTPEPTETPLPTPTPTQTPLELAQSATVRIVPQGSEFLETLIGTGTGVIYDSSGLVLTSNHLVDGAGLVQVSIEGQEESLSAQIIGRSACDNLAVLQLLGSDFPAINIDVSDALEETVQIIGYPLDEPEQNIEETSVVEQEPSSTLIPAGFSAVTGTLELDTALDTGYSGAPILTTDGRFVGLVTYPGNGDSPATALPLQTIRPIIGQLEQGNNLNWVGLNAGMITAEEAEEIGIESTAGLFVYAVDFRGPAGAADIRNGDIITEIAGADLTSEDGFTNYCAALRDYSEGDPLDITVVRAGERYVGQINGDPLTEEVVVVLPPEGEAPPPPPANDVKSTLLAIIQTTDADMRSIGGTIDSLATNGCLGPQLLAASSDDSPAASGPTAENQAHPGCIHSISDCQVILDKYARITNPPAIDVTNASQEVIDANASLQSSISTFVNGATSLIEACRAFVNDPNLTINALAFGLARQGIDNALNILAPALQALQA